ncbi:hypothetical protein BJV82DRAFT_35280 [Fennellomyces sp. T-0311]|nr:hypothetical protein BJV82DRAFT_35280 [Fennellomyces sp. T-0311]
MITLWHVKDTLTDLSISMDRTSPPLPLGVILSTCCNLTKLHCAQYNVVPTAEALGSMPTKPINSLVDLSMDFSKIDLKELELILRCCPRLRYLMIKQCDSDAIGLARRLCPDLRALGFNLPPPAQNREKEIVASGSRNGIRYLSMLQYTSQSAVQPTGLLLDCAPMVENIVLGLPLDTTINAEDILLQWNPIATTTYCNLKTLSLAYHRRYGPLVSRLLLHCPNLMELMFADCSIDQETFRSILRLRNLRKLAIEAVNDVNYGGLIEMLAGFSIPGAPAIQAIDISDCQFELTDGMFQFLAVIPSLRNIHLSDLVCENQGAFERFASTLRDGPSAVTNIILSGLPFVTDKALENINGISSLRSIELYGLDSVTPQGLQCLYSNSRISALIDM